MQKVSLECSLCDARSISFLRYCTPEQADNIRQNKHCIHYKKSQTLFYEDSIAQGVYCISSGVVKLSKNGFDGREQILRFSKSGDFLGYRALIADEPFVASATCIEDTVACFIPRAQFMELLHENPHINQSMMKALCHEIGLADEKITSLAHKSVRERLAEALLLLHETFYLENSGKPEELIQISLPREDIANIVGTATETVIRLLSEMNKEGVILLEGKKISILKKRALQKIAHTEA